MDSVNQAPSTGGDSPSGRFVLRIAPGLHTRLRSEAKASGLSLNEFCARKLAQPASVLTEPGASVVGLATKLFDEALVGVVAYGSWVRGELASTSDIDMLVILDPRVALTRDLYRRWDRSPLTWGAHPIEPHFIHLPASTAPVTGVWAEAALGGVVLFEHDLGISGRLVGIRRRILEGHLVRRRVHGQSYWVEAA